MNRSYCVTTIKGGGACERKGAATAAVVLQKSDEENFLPRGHSALDFVCLEDSTSIFAMVDGFDQLS